MYPIGASEQGGGGVSDPPFKIWGGGLSMFVDMTEDTI